MTRVVIFAFLAAIYPASLLAAAPTSANSAEPTANSVTQGQEASIPFANQGGVRNWQAAGQDGIYIQDQHGRWYYGKFLGSCNALPFADNVSFDIRGTDQIDRYATVIANRERCMLTSLVTSDGPQKKVKKKKVKKLKKVKISE